MRLAWEDELPSHRIGRRRFFVESDVQAFLERARDGNVSSLHQHGDEGRF